MRTTLHRVCEWLAAMSLLACGYPTDPDKWLPDFGIQGEHGAIAVNAADMVGALTARYLNQDEADAKALQLCGKGCSIALRFEGAGSCGALASSTNRKLGVGSGPAAALAVEAAIAQCRSNGGSDCVVKLQGCND